MCPFLRWRIKEEKRKLTKSDIEKANHGNGLVPNGMGKKLGTFCKPKFGNFDGNGPRPGERCETNWRIFAKIHPNVRLEGPSWNRTKFSVRFSLAGSSLPMWPCASAVWDCRTPHQLLLFLSLLQLCHHFRDRRALQRQFRLLQLQYVLQLRTPGYYETIDLSLGGCRDS